MIMAGDYYSLNIIVCSFVYECCPTDVYDRGLLSHHVKVDKY